MASRPTRPQYMAYAISLVGYYGHGAGGKENDVPFNTKYYGKHVSGSNWSWCRVFEWFVDDHFGMAEDNGGKSAYVPANVKGKTARIWHKPKRGSEAYTEGNKVNLDFNHTGEAEHTELYWKPRNTTSFWTVGGNTGDDQVAKRIRYYSDVLDVIETVGFATDSTSTKGNDVPDYVSLSTGSVAVQPDKEFYAKWEVVNSDKGNRFGDKGDNAVFVAGKNGSVYTTNVKLTGPATYEICEMRKNKDGDWEQLDNDTTGGIDLADAGSHLWVKVTPHQAGEVTVVAKTAIWDR